MKIHAFRLTKSKDLRKEIEQYAQRYKIRAGIVLICIGSLEKAALRMAGAKETKVITTPLEILSLAGTIGIDDSHLHLTISDQDGQVTGGHLKEGSIIRTTAEIIIGELEGFMFKRKLDSETGFEEIEIIKD